MTVAMQETREDKLKWLLRPVEWASGLSFFGAVFGLVYWLDGLYRADQIVLALCAVLGVNFALLLWAINRMTRAARGE